MTPAQLASVEERLGHADTSLTELIEALPEGHPEKEILVAAQQSVMRLYAEVEATPEAGGGD